MYYTYYELNRTPKPDTGLLAVCGMITTIVLCLLTIGMAWGVL